MKKFSLLILGLLFFVSCSNDNEDTAIDNKNASSALSGNYQQKSGNALKTLYEAMTASQIYIDYDSAIQTFVAKMKFTGDSSQINTETKMLNWISGNIALTDFTNYTEAETLWSNIKGQGKKVVSDNELFFYTLSGAKKEDFIILLPEPEVVPASNPCMDACASTFNSTMAEVMSDYTDSMQENAQMFAITGDGHALALSFGLSLTTFQNDSGEAASAYADCIIPCL